VADVRTLTTGYVQRLVETARRDADGRRRFTGLILDALRPRTIACGPTRTRRA